MKFLYLDESGDLGFDFVNKKPSKYFTITILAIDGLANNRQIINGAKKTIIRKMRTRNTRGVLELKGSEASLEIKQFFYDKIKHIPFQIYSITLNKEKVILKKNINPTSIYNKLSLEVINQINFNDIALKVDFKLDKSKRKRGILDFNNLIENSFKLKIKNNIILDIEHIKSEEDFGIQACDLFNAGIYQKYESQKTQWLEVFKEKVVCDLMINELGI